MSQTLTLLLIGDIHYAGFSEESVPPERRPARGLEFLRRIRRRLAQSGKPDALILMGDVLNNGRDGRAPEDLRRVKEALDEFGVPVIVLPGNHDGDYQTFYAALGDRPGTHLIKDFLIYAFADPYLPGDYCTRSTTDLADFEQAVSLHPERKIITLQHNPVYPPVHLPPMSTYPYNLTNADEVASCYAFHDVALSISGHYHPGTSLTYKSRTAFLTVPALCEQPFSFVFVQVSGHSVTVTPDYLYNDQPLGDNHCHTQFAYCGEDVTVEAVLDRAALLGVSTIAFAEHAGQLYLAPDDYWNCRYYTDPDIIRRSRDRGADRVIAAYVRAVREAQTGPATLGAEVEMDGTGSLTLLPEDRHLFSFLIGAIHYIPETDSTTERESLFLRDTERLLAQRVNILAHPFRYFTRHKLPPPEHLFRPVARMLARYGVAAEINYHTYNPEPAFFSACLEEGARLSLGSDAHNLCEVGEFSRHAAFLRDLGVTPDRFPQILYYPGR